MRYLFVYIKPEVLSNLFYISETDIGIYLKYLHTTV